MTLSAAASVPTSHASRYLQQLCKHWAHNLGVEFTPEHGRVTFPRNARGADHPGDAVVTFDARSDALDIRVDASSEAQLEGVKGAVRAPPRPFRVPRGSADLRMGVNLRPR